MLKKFRIPALSREFAADETLGLKIPFIKLLFGTAGVATPVSMDNPLPVAIVSGGGGGEGGGGDASAALQGEGNSRLGALDEAAPANDTAASGLNGRMQRVAQRLTSLLDRLPATLGAKARAASLAVTLATEDQALVGTLTEAAPANDTASAGLNGRLQRIAQRLTSLIALLPASLGAKTAAASLSVTAASDGFPVAPRLTSGGNVEISTAGNGTDYTAFANQACSQLTVVNDSGTKIAVRQGGAGIAVSIPDGAAFTFFGISNASALSLRRKDVATDIVAVQARWEA